MCIKILCDTRQQAGKHRNIDTWLGAHGVPYEYKKLDYGDYQRTGSNVSIDTKQGLVELSGNLGREHARFVRELDRASAAGFRLVVLVEAGERYEDRSLIEGWVPYPCKRCRMCDPLVDDGCRRYRCRPMQGSSMVKIMATLERRHGVRFAFCSKRDTARTICDLLGVTYEDGG
jgi:hypothetical protein